MPMTVLAGLARLRIALMIAGLSWLFGVTPPPGMRVVLAVIVLGALVLDAAIDERRVERTTVRLKTGTDYKTTA